MDRHLDPEYRSLLLHENDFSDAPQFASCAQWSSKLSERRGIQLSQGVAQMLQLWPALLSNVLRTFLLVLIACFVFVLAILTLVFTTNFSLISPYPLQPLHLQTRSIHALPPDIATQCRDHTETIYRYIITGSEDTVNLFYVIHQEESLSSYAKKLLKFYVRAGYKVFLIRVCRTKFLDKEELEAGRKKSDSPGRSLKKTTTADVETYDANMRREISADFGQSREFFDRLRQFMSRNRTFEEDEKDSELNRIANEIPLTSCEINVTQSDDELKKVQLCTCPGCGHVKTKGRAAVFGANWRDVDLAQVEFLNVNYCEFLRGSLFESASEVCSVDVNMSQVDRVGENSIDKRGVSEHYDLNLVKLLLLWKFGNSVVLLDDQTTLFHSKLIDRGRVNLGFHLIYTPYECASVVYNLMSEYRKERNMRRTVGDVYRKFCKRARGFCNAIRYVEAKKRK